MTRLERGIAVTAGVCILVVLLAAPGCSSRRAEQYRQEGETYLRLNKLDEATTAFTRAEEADPSNARAKTGLGRVHLAREEYEEAFDKFMEAAQLDPTIGDDLESAVEILIRAGRTNEALALVERFRSTNPLSGGMLHAYLLREAGQAGEAVASLEPLVQQYPENAEVRLSLARSYLAAEQSEKAESTLMEALALPTVDPTEARMLLVDVYTTQGRLSQAIDVFRQAVDENPVDTSAKLALARALVENGEIKEAQEVASGVLEAEAGSPWAQYVLGSVALAENKATDALSLLQEASQRLPRERAIQRKMAAAQRAVRGDASGAEETASAPPAEDVLLAEDRLPDWQTLWRQASLRRLLENREVYLQQDTSAELQETLLLAALFTQQTDLARELTASLPEESPLKGYLVLLENPKVESIKAFFEAWQSDPEKDDIIRFNALGNALATVGARAQAVYAFSQAYEQHPENVVALYCIAQVYRAAQMPLFAARALERVVSNALDNAEAHTMLFVVLRQADRADEARAAAESAYSLFPRDKQILLNLAQAYLDAGEFALAAQALERGREYHPTDPSLRVALAGVLLHQDKPAEARTILENLDGPDVLMQEAKALRAFASAQEGTWEETATLLEDSAFRNLQSATQRLAVSAFLYTNRPQDVQQALDDVGESDMPEFAPGQQAAAFYASALQQRRLYRHAYEQYQALSSGVEPSPWLIHNMLASLASAPTVEDRLAIARAVAEQHSGMEEAWLGLAMVARAVKDTAAEDDALARAVEVVPASAVAWQRRAEFLEREKRVPEAQQAYESLVALAPQSAAANNNLAYCILMTGGDQKLALEHAQRARDLLPSNPGVLHTLGLAQMRTGDLEQARRNLSIALELMPANPTLLLDFGLLTMRMGDEPAGKHYVELALRYADQLRLEFDRRSEAEQLLAAESKTPEAA